MINSEVVFNNHVLIIDLKETFDVMRALKDELGFNMLLDVCGVDNLKRPKSEWELIISIKEILLKR